METLQERFKRLSKEVDKKYDIYLKAHRKAAKDKANQLLQKLEQVRKQEWLDAIKAKRAG